ncbi:MAG: transposase [Actinomycetota bacterium]|nr:transposase [Actinomycetota bacterium]
MAERHDAWFSITARNTERVAAAIDALLADPEIVWRPAAGNEHDRGSEIAETSVVVGPMTSPPPHAAADRAATARRAGTQLSFDDRHAWRFHAIVTNIPETDRDAVAVEQHHRLRGGVPEDVIRQLKEDFGFSHAPLSAFHGNWLWWHACALAYNTALWLRRLALPAAFRRVRGKRLRLAFLNVAARVGSHARRFQLKFARGYRWLAEFTTAVVRLHVLPAFH